MKAAGLTKETILDLGVTDRGFPNFSVGDHIEVSQTVKEGNKERIQKFEGDVIAVNNGKTIGSTFTVRKIGANNIGVERIYPYHSPIIKEIKLLHTGRVRRAKIFFIRELSSKKTRKKLRSHSS